MKNKQVLILVVCLVGLLQAADLRAGEYAVSAYEYIPGTYTYPGGSPAPAPWMQDIPYGQLTDGIYLLTSENYTSSKNVAWSLPNDTGPTVYFDLGQTQPLADVRIAYCVDAGGVCGPRNVTIAFSSLANPNRTDIHDTTDWTESGYAGDFPNTTGNRLHTFTLAGHTARWVRMRFMYHSGDYYNPWAVLTEIDFFTPVAQATWPRPANDRLFPSLNGQVLLRWASGANAASHDVYLGDNAASVQSADRNDDEYQGNTTETTFTTPTLSPGVTWHWRIDERDGADQLIATGTLWHFQASDAWLFNVDSRLQWEEMINLYCLQGLINRDHPCLFINGPVDAFNPDDDAKHLYWMNYLKTAKDFPDFAEVYNFRELIQLAKEYQLLDGLVLYDTANADGAERYIAENYCSLQNLMPGTPAMLDNLSFGLKFYGSDRCFDDLPVTDIRGQWATNLAAQTWAFTNQLPLFRKDAVFNNILFEAPVSLDYATQQRIFVFSLSTYNVPTEERQLYINIMQALDPPAAVMGCFGAEYDDTAYACAFGNFTFLTAASTNLSFHSQVPVSDPNRLNLANPGTNPILDDSKYYILNQTTEGDTMKIVTGAYGNPQSQTGWFDAQRGDVAIAWGMPPLAHRLFPALVEHFYATRSDRDSFFAGPSGGGYCFPENDRMPNLPQFAQFTDQLLQDIGFAAVDCWGFYDADAHQTYTENAPTVRLFTGEVGGAAGVNTYLDNGVPFARCGEGLYYPNTPSDQPQNIIPLIENVASLNEPPFFIVIYGYWEYAYACTDGVAPDLPGQYEFVTVEDFADLMSQANPQPIQHDVTSSACGDETTTLSWPHQVAQGMNRMLVVGVAMEDTVPADMQIASVTYGTMPLLPVPDAAISEGDGWRIKTDLYYLPAPPPGLADVTVNFQGPISRALAVATSLVNVNQQVPEAVGAAGTSLSSTITANLTTSTDAAWIVDVAGCGNDGLFTAGAGQVERQQQVCPTATVALSTKLVTNAGPASVSWTHNNANRLALSAAAFAPQRPLPPAVPDAPAPAHLAEDVDTILTLAWDPCPHAESYRVYLGTTVNLTEAHLLGQTTDPNFHVPDLEPLTYHYWKVQAVNSRWTSDGPIWCFTTGPLPADLQGDGYVDIIDLLIFSWYWLNPSCAPANDWCYHADINHDGCVDMHDFAAFAAYWLR